MMAPKVIKAYTIAKKMAKGDDYRLLKRLIQ
jgi:hypothetical protein